MNVSSHTLSSQYISAFVYIIDIIWLFQDIAFFFHIDLGL